MRYEDLKLNPVPVLIELFCFLLDVPSIQGTAIEKRILQVTADGFRNKTAYALKDLSNDLNRNRHMYKDYQIASMSSELKEMIQFWKYGEAVNDENEVETNFFKNVTEHSPY